MMNRTMWLPIFPNRITFEAPSNGTTSPMSHRHEAHEVWNRMQQTRSIDEAKGA